MKPKNRSYFPSTLSVVLGLIALPVASHAVDATWSGATDGQWNTAGNWNAAVPANGTATFNNATNTTINLASDLSQFRVNFDTNTVGSFTFNTTTGRKFIANGSGQGVFINSNVTGSQVITFNVAYQITPSARTSNYDWSFSNNNTNAASKMVFNADVYAGVTSAGLAGRLNIGGAGNVELNGVVSDGAGPGGLLIKKSAGGTLTLANANTFTGGVETTTNAGKIILGNKAALGTGALRLVGGSGSIMEASTDLSGANALANTVNYVSFTSGTNTTTNLNITTTAGSNVAIWNSGTAPLVGDLVTVTGALPYYARVTGVSGAAGAGTITFSANAGVANTGAITTTPFTTANGTVAIAGTNKIEFSGTQNLTTVWSAGGVGTNAQTFNITNTADTIFSGALQQQGGVASVTKTGTGKLILSGTNTYTGNTTITTGILQLGNGGTVGSLSTTGAIANNANLTINRSNAVLQGTDFSGAAITGSGSLTLAGTNTTTLTAANNFTGGTTINSGSTLQLGNSGTTGALSTTGAIVNNGTLIINRTNAVTQGTDFSAAAMTGTGSVVQNSATSNYTQFTLNSANNSYSGTTMIRNGYLNVGANNITSGANGPLGNATSAIILGDAGTVASTYGGNGPNVVLVVQGLNNANIQNFTINRDVDSSAAANVAGRNDIAYNNANSGAQGSLTVSGNWALSTGATRTNGLWAQRAGQMIDFTGAITGGNSATRLRFGDFGQGVGTVRLSNSGNTYASETVVTAGRLLIAGDAGASSGVLGTNANLRMAESGNATPNNTALIDGAYTVGKTISLENGATTNSTWTLGGNQAAVSSFTGAINTVTNANSRNLLVSQVSGGTVSFTGVIGANADATGVTNVEKTGDGTAILSNANMFDGSTTVTAGTLLANNTTGSATGAGAVTVGAGGTLGGSGSISGMINVSGVLAPGASIESLGSGALSFSTGSTLAYELNSTTLNGDLVDSTGTLDIAVGTTLTLTDLSAGTLAAGSKLTLISYFGGWDITELFSYNASTLTDNSTFTLGANEWLFDYNDTTGGSNFAGDQTGATSFVTMTVVPEPAAALLGGLGLLTLLRRRRGVC